MMVPVGQSHLDGLMRQPDEVGGAETQSCYLVVADVDKHYARAKAAGAESLLSWRAMRSASVATPAATGKAIFGPSERMIPFSGDRGKGTWLQIARMAASSADDLAASVGS